MPEYTWISVADSLPDEDVDVLVEDSQGYVQIACRDEAWPLSWWNRSTGLPCMEIIYWMPIPARKATR